MDMRYGMLAEPVNWQLILASLCPYQSDQMPPISPSMARPLEESLIARFGHALIAHTSARSASASFGSKFWIVSLGFSVSSLVQPDELPF